MPTRRLELTAPAGYRGRPDADADADPGANREAAQSDEFGLRGTAVSRTIAIYGRSFNPPGLHHREAAISLRRELGFNEVIVIP